LLKGPEISYKVIERLTQDEQDLPVDVKEQVETQDKYEGYIKKAEDQVQRMVYMEDKRIAKNIDYEDISRIATEAQDKLKNIQPLSIGQASRIAGVNPADISVLLVYIEQGKFETTTS